MRQNKFEYDAFISHAVEDKIPIANELCAKLERAGLRIWYSGKELGVGDSIEKTIEKGLNRSRYGIVIFSPTYLAKNWTIREFYTLLAKEIEEQKVILPVLYNITVDDLKKKDLVMADRFAVSADRGVDFVVERLVREIKKTKEVKLQPAWFSRMWAVLLLSLLANAAFVLKGTVFSNSPSHSRTEAVSFPAEPGVDAAFLGQIEGMFNRLSSGCKCGESEHRDVPVRTVSLSSNVPGPPAGLLVSDNQQGQGKPPRRYGARKMTMAVVFQIETGDEAGDSRPEAKAVPSANSEGDPSLLSMAMENAVRECERSASLRTEIALREK